MTEVRSLARDAYLAIKAATRRQVVASGGVEAAASVTRVGKTMLSDYGSPNHPGQYMPVDVLADLTTDSGEPILLRALAALAGYRLVPCEDEPPGARGDGDAATVVEIGARAAARAGAYCGAALDAAADGQVTDAELDRLIAAKEANYRQTEREYDELCRWRAARRSARRAA